MTDKLNEQCRGLSRFLCGAGERRIIVLYAVAGSGLTTALDELRAGAPSMACVLDDAQRRPGKVQAALARLRGESAARLLAGVDEDDDHPSRVAVADGLGDLVGVGAQARLEPVADELLDAMWRDVVPRTDPAVAAALVQRAGGRPARLRHLLSLPQLERRIRDGRLLMHPDEIAALPVEGAGALRNRWVRLTASERQLVVAVWIAGGRVAAAHLRDHLRQSGLVAVAAAAARAPWLTEDDDELWLGKRLTGLLESLGPQAPIVHDMRESLADFLAQPAAAVAVAPKAKPTAKPPVHGKPKPKPATHPKPAAHGQPKPKPKQGKPKPKPAKQPQPPPDFEKTEAMLFVAARQAEARSDFATAERTHRERIVLFEQARGPRSGPAFGARRHLVKCLMLAKDRAGAVEELRSLAADTEAARGPSSPLVCEILFEFGVCALEAGDTRGLERAKEALSRFKALGREDKVAAGERRLKRATNPRSRPKHS